MQDLDQPTANIAEEQPCPEVQRKLAMDWRLLGHHPARTIPPPRRPKSSLNDIRQGLLAERQGGYQTLQARVLISQLA